MASQDDEDYDMEKDWDDIWGEINFDSYAESSSFNQEIDNLDHDMVHYWCYGGRNTAASINVETGLSEKFNRTMNNIDDRANPNLGQRYGGGSDSNQQQEVYHGGGSSSNQGESGLSEEFNKIPRTHEDVDTNETKEESPIRLKLTTLPQDINHIETTLTRMSDKIKTEKIKASNFQISLLRVGDFVLKSKHEGQLTAKIYYAKRKLVWEYLVGVLKQKIEMSFSDVVGIRANLASSTLEVELSHPPSFAKEVDTQRGKHTKWEDSGDFTSGQASCFRRHLLEFPPNTLDKHYEKLLQHDKRLYTLSRSRFPTHLPINFNTNQFAPPHAAHPGLSTIPMGNPNPNSFNMTGPSANSGQRNFSGVRGVMNPGLKRENQYHQPQNFNTRGLMIPGILENNVPNYNIGQHSTHDTRGMMNPGFGEENITMPRDTGGMMKPGLGSNLQNNTARRFNPWMMTPEILENDLLNYYSAHQYDLNPNTGGVMIPGLENNVPNNIAHHSTLDTRGMMNPVFGHTLQNNTAPDFNTGLMNHEVKLEMNTHFQDNAHFYRTRNPAAGESYTQMSKLGESSVSALPACQQQMIGSVQNNPTSNAQDGLNQVFQMQPPKNYRGHQIG